MGNEMGGWKIELLADENFSLDSRRKDQLSQLLIFFVSQLKVIGLEVGIKEISLKKVIVKINMEVAKKILVEEFSWADKYKDPEMMKNLTHKDYVEIAKKLDESYDRINKRLVNEGMLSLSKSEISRLADDLINLDKFSSN